MKLLQKLLYFAILRVHLWIHRRRHAERDFWDYLADRLQQTRHPTEARCLRYWLFARALDGQNADRVRRAFNWMRHANPGLHVSDRHAVAVAESCLWLQDKDTATALLTLIQQGHVHLEEPNLHRLMQLYVWRFGSDPAKAEKLLELQAGETFLPYLDPWARGQVALALGRTKEAAGYLKVAAEMLRAADPTTAKAA